MPSPSRKGDGWLPLFHSSAKEMMKSPVIFILGACALVSSCKVYRSYERPDDLPTDSLYRDPVTGETLAETDTLNFGNRPWREVFTDPQLQSLIETALANNTDLRQAQLTIEQAEASLKPTRLAYLPSFSFSPEGTLSSFDGAKTTKTYSLPIAASWQFGSIGSLRNTMKQAQANLYQAQASKQSVQTSLISSVANMYYTLLMLDEQLKLTKETAELWKENVETMKAMQVAAMNTAAAVLQSEASYQGVLATIPTLEQSIRSTENSLCTILHEAPHTIERGSFYAQQFPSDMSVGIPMQLLSNRPDVKVAEMNLRAAFYATNLAHSAFYPSITLSGSAGWTNSGGTGITNPAKFLASAVASLVQPLFQNGQLRANLKIAKAQQESAQLDFEQALLNAGEEISTALGSYQTAIQQADARKKQVEALEQAVVQIKDLFLYDSSTTYLEILTAQQSLLSAQLDLISDQFDRIQAAITLYQALGGGRD